MAGSLFRRFFVLVGAVAVIGLCILGLNLNSCNRPRKDCALPQPRPYTYQSADVAHLRNAPKDDSALPDHPPEESFLDDMVADFGKCACPLRNEPLTPGWVFECSVFDHGIARSLSPWWGHTLAPEVIDHVFHVKTANLQPPYRLSIVNGTVWRGMRKAAPMAANLGAMMRDVSAAVVLPNVEFVLHLWDHPKVPIQDPYPLFSYVTSGDTADIAIPSPGNWVGDMEWKVEEMGCPVFAEREEVAFWRGSCMGPQQGHQLVLWRHYPRLRLNALTKSFPEHVDAGVQDKCADFADVPGVSAMKRDEWETQMLAEGPPLSSFVRERHCKVKYLIQVDGATVSGRMANLLRMGSVVLKQKSPFKEYYYDDLVPWVHYIPLSRDLHDLVAKVKWLNAHPSQAARIGQNGRDFALKHLGRDGVSCFWWRILSEYGRWQKHSPRVDSVMVELKKREAP